MSSTLYESAQGQSVPPHFRAGTPSLVMLIDSVAKDRERKRLFEYLNEPGWLFGWKSSDNSEPFSFWHKHFSGSTVPDAGIEKGTSGTNDCAAELQEKYPLVFTLWQRLQEVALKGHTLVRCYANGMPYGSEGTVHVDSASPRSFTTIYYPHEQWHPNWGGETVFFNQEKNEIVAAILPKSNRAVMFRGIVPHAARGVSRICPIMRITVMFKSELR